MKLENFAYNEKQQEIARLREEGLGWTEIGKRVDSTPSNVRTSYLRTLRRAAKHGFAPDSDMTKVAAAGFSVKGVSSLYDHDGDLRAQWVKTDRERESIQEALEAFVEGLTDGLQPIKRKPLPKSKKWNNDLMNGVFIGDAHIGMRAFGLETKHSDFDTDIATSQLREAIDYLVERAESTETGLLVNVGDLIHANTQHGTTYGGTPLDVDTRHYRVMKAAAEAMVYMIDRMLEKHKKVVVVMARGNHDTDAAGALQLILEAAYRKEPRVNVLPTDGFYHYVEYGKWLLGIHHGDKQKAEKLAASMARDMSEAWGRTTHRLWCTGHFHKEALKTLEGVKHKVFAALPPPDSWHASHGFAGDGEMEMLTFKREGGLHSSFVFNVPQPKAEPDVRIG